MASFRPLGYAGRMTKIPLMLLPGLLCDAEVWAAQSQGLSDIAEIIIPNFNQATSPLEMVDCVRKIAPPTFALAGHSMGGWIALEVMKHFPARVLKLGLLNTSALPDSPKKQSARLSLISHAEKGDFAFILDALIQKFLYRLDLAPKVRAMLERNQSAFIHQEKAMLMREDCLEILKQITCPSLIVHAEKDQVFNLHDSQFLAEHIPNSELHIIPNSGHMSPMEAPEILTQHLRRWLLN